jgi:arylsulfatase A-like enzyme
MITPNLERFANQSQIFENCHASSFPTVPARADIFTGRYTFTYLDWGPLPADEITLAQVLQDGGYTTFGVADTPFLVRNAYGQDRGFQDFLHIRGQRDGLERKDWRKRRCSEADLFAPMTFQAGMDWLERNYQQQFFLYIDTWDPHEPWDPPSYYVTPYLPDYKGEAIEPSYWDYKESGLSQRDVEIAHACYCGEISMVDYWFGQLMERVRTLNLLEDTAIIFTSDHGFYFGEHGQLGKRRFRWPDNLSFYEGFEKGLSLEHGFTYRSPLHNEVSRVPLLVYLPGVQSRRVAGLTSLPDLMPTLLEIAGQPIPERVQAPSAMPLIRGESETINPIIVTSAPFEERGGFSKTVDDKTREAKEISPSTITDGTWDLLYSVYGDPVELYDRINDPGHQNNLFPGARGIAEELHARFVKWMEKMGVPEKELAPRRKL